MQSGSRSYIIIGDLSQGMLLNAVLRIDWCVVESVVYSQNSYPNMILGTKESVNWTILYRIIHLRLHHFIRCIVWYDDKFCHTSTIYVLVIGHYVCTSCCIHTYPRIICWRSYHHKISTLDYISHPPFTPDILSHCYMVIKFDVGAHHNTSFVSHVYHVIFGFISSSHIISPLSCFITPYTNGCTYYSIPHSGPHTKPNET